MKTLFVLICLCLSPAAHSESRNDVVCSYAPSQSRLVTTTLGAAGGAGGTVAALAHATGMTVVTHSSGAYILSGSGGYIAGTLGGAALAGPAIVVVSLVVGTAAGTVELLCAPKNHPKEVAKVHAAADEFRRRSENLINKSAGAFGRTETYTKSVVIRATAKIREVSGDVYRYAYRKD